MNRAEKKYHIKAKLCELSESEFKQARKDLPKKTGFTWKVIWYQWGELEITKKGIIPEEPLQKIAQYFGCSPDDLKNFNPS